MAPTSPSLSQTHCGVDWKPEFSGDFFMSGDAYFTRASVGCPEHERARRKVCPGDTHVWAGQRPQRRSFAMHDWSHAHGLERLAYEDREAGIQQPMKQLSY
eukprot:285438-Chlamydomonas_euryale.AAC.3